MWAANDDQIISLKKSCCYLFIFTNMVRFTMLNNTNTANHIHDYNTVLLKKVFNICLNKRECYKQWSTENASEKMKVDLMLVKNAG